MTEIKQRAYRRGELKTTLSEGEKACLRLVLDELSSKQIAAKLNVSPHTVDARLKASMAYFQTDSRIVAAKRLSDLENSPNEVGLVYQIRPRLVHQAQHIATLDHPRSVAGDANQGEKGKIHVADISSMFTQVSETGAAYANCIPGDTLLNQPAADECNRPWERENNLTIKQRLLAMLAIAGLAIFVFGFFVNSVGTLSRLLAS